MRSRETSSGADPSPTETLRVPMGQVFLSYNKADKAAVERLAHRLSEQGIDIWLDAQSLAAGEVWQSAIERVLGTCSACLVFCGSSGMSPWQDAEIRVVLDRRNSADPVRIIPVFLPGVQGDRRELLPAFLRQSMWVEFPALEDVEALRRLLGGLQGLASGARTASPGSGPAPPPALDPDKLAGLVFEADVARNYGEDLLPRSGPWTAYSLQDEGVILIKPGGTFYKPCMREIFRRIGVHCQIVQVRLFDGNTVHERGLFDRQYRSPIGLASEEIPLGEADFTKIRLIYDVPEFHSRFGVPYSPSLVVGALRLCGPDFHVSAEELTTKWDAGRSTDLFWKDQWNGCNKIGYQKTVFPIEFDKIGTKIVLNGFIPGYRRLFAAPGARTVAIHVATREPWLNVRDHLVGGQSNPTKCQVGSIRRDAADNPKTFPLDPRDSLVNGQRNVCHCSATLLDGMNELMIWFDLDPERTNLGQRFRIEGIPLDKVVNLIAESLWPLSWTTRDYTLARFAVEWLRPMVDADLRPASRERARKMDDYARKAGVGSRAPGALSQVFRDYVENGLRLEMGGDEYYLHVIGANLGQGEDRQVFHEVAGAIRRLAAARTPEPSPEARAEAYRIAANDLLFLRCPAYSDQVASPLLFRHQVITELPAEALECALRTEANLIKEVRSIQKRASDFSPTTIGGSPEWAEFAAHAPAVPVDAPVVGLILCGGRSTRMGSTIPKPVLPFRNRLMFNSVEGYLAAAGHGAVPIFAAVGFRSSLIQRALGDQVRYLEFEKTLGLGFRVAACLEMLRDHPGLVILAYTDMPLIDPLSVRRLIESVTRHPRAFGLLTSGNESLSGHVERGEDDKIIRIIQRRLEPNRARPYGQERDVGVYAFHNTSEFRDALMEVSNDNVRGEYMFADVVEVLSRRHWDIVDVEEDDTRAFGINTSRDLLYLAAQMNDADKFTIDLASARMALDGHYHLKVRDELGGHALYDSVGNHRGPFYFFDWWDREWDSNLLR
jgi:CTP:molybdopterin cytidylyltransferase MocA